MTAMGPERIDPAGLWWKGHVTGYGAAAGDGDLAGRHAEAAHRVAEMDDLEFEDWWDGYCAGWEDGCPGRDHPGTETGPTRDGSPSPSATPAGGGRLVRLGRRLGVEALAGVTVGAGVHAAGLVPVEATAWFVAGVLALAAAADRTQRWRVRRGATEGVFAQVRETGVSRCFRGGWTR